MYGSYEELPTWLKKRLGEVFGDDLAERVRRSVPALANRSILDVMNMADGESEIRAYLVRVESKFR